MNRQNFRLQSGYLKIFSNIETKKPIFINLSGCDLHHNHPLGPEV